VASHRDGDEQLFADLDVVSVSEIFFVNQTRILNERWMLKDIFHPRMECQSGERDK
jgi:hypothetical protein